MDFDPELKPVDPRVDYSFGFRANPSKTVGMTYDKLWQTAWKDGELDASKPREKTTTKLKVDHGDCKTETAFSSEKFSLKADAVLLSKDGYKSTLQTTLEAKYLKEAWKASGVFSLVTPDLGGAKVNTQLEGEVESWDAKNNKRPQKVRGKVNFELSEEVNIGLHGEHDTAALTRGLAQAVYAPKAGGLFWLRSNVLTKEVSAGCDNELKSNIQHSWEGVLSWGDAKGIMGMPFFLRGGVSYDLSDATSLDVSGSWGGDVNVSQTVSHKCDKNWTVSATQTYDQENLKRSQGAYHIGFGLTYKL